MHQNKLKHKYKNIMKKTSYPEFLKHKELQETILSTQAAILFNNNITEIIWANPQAKISLGCNPYGQKIENKNPFGNITVRQIKTITENLKNNKKNAFVRIGHKLVNAEFSKINPGILMITQQIKRNNIKQIAQNTVDVINEPAAIIDEKNNVIAQNSKFKNQNIKQGDVTNIKIGKIILVIKTSQEIKNTKQKNTSVGEFWTSKKPKENTRWYFKQNKNDKINKTKQNKQETEHKPPQNKPTQFTSTRFSWEMNADRKFVNVSGELEDAVGSKAKKIIGMTWEQVTKLLNIKQTQEVAQLLKTEDTWSDKTVFMSVGETGYNVPVDLAGLPTYDKNKKFNGFTGFGIIRMDDKTKETKQPKTKKLTDEENKNFEEITKTLLNNQNNDEGTGENQNKQQEPIPAAFADQTNQKPDTSILTKLPIPVLIYRQQKLLFANQKFFDVTGYQNLNGLKNAGGVDALYKKDGSTDILDCQGENINAEAKMQCVPWDNKRAIMLTIRKKNNQNDSGQVSQADITNTQENNQPDENITKQELNNARKKAENENKHKSEFITKLSHEIRTPLNAIIGFSEIIADKKIKKINQNKYQEYANDIKNAGNHVLGLVNDMLDIAKIEANKNQMNFQECNINNIIAEAINMCQTNANKKQIIIRTNIPDNIPNVIADKKSMRQIIINLVNNSVKFSGAGGQVIVSVERSNGVTIKIKDTGQGMNQQEINKALMPFETSHANQNSNNGTGLGLPLTKAMVKANKANFNIFSKPGEGTRVEINFATQQILADR